MNSRKTTKTSILPSTFWTAVDILVNKPHVINKRLWGCKPIFYLNCDSLAHIALKPSHRLNSSSPKFEELEEILQNLELGKVCILKNNNDSEANALVLELLPKCYEEKHAYQLVCLCKEYNKVYFYNLTPNECDQKLCPEFPFSLYLENDHLVLESVCDETNKSYVWLTSVVMPQFLKWGEETVDNSYKNLPSSLSLITADEYYYKYNNLKLKYGKEMVRIWPECTDPAKFVYEDIAIATYLLLLWANERRLQQNDNPQSFVDLGCGNGLLVYILTMEGHEGFGIDVRRRNIWDLYPKSVILEEKTIIPSDLFLFPKTNWIIGNHSDELTPWVPAIAARSSYSCNFFLLPCCAYNFDGTKYQRHDASKSQYTEYLGYIRQLSIKFGFLVDIDRLKIPSTKRICLVSKGRSYPESDQINMCNKIQEIIGMPNDICINKDTVNESWLKEFKPREVIEKVRNCTQLDKTLLDSLINSVTKCLLEELDLQSDWSPGKTVSINDIVQLIPQNQLDALKSECGGLQTLLKNNHHIFKVQEGKVQLRYPRTVEEVYKQNNRKTSNKKIKLRPCWFFTNHPQGCPLTNTACSFLHEQ